MTGSPRRRLVAVLGALALLGASCSDGDGGDTSTEIGDPASTVVEGEGVEGTVTVFAAASLTEVFTELGDAFEEANPGATVELGFGPSSGLVTQVTEGAPADVVATAATSNMDDLVEADALDGDPVDVATNALELAVPVGNPGAVDGLEDLADEDLVVGLCNEDVPCGRFAREALEAAGITPAVDTDAEDVRALLTQVEAGQVDVGVVYRTDVIAAGDAVEGIAIPDDQNVVATYPVAAVAGSENVDGARAFIAFLLSEEGQRALADAGFGPVA